MTAGKFKLISWDYLAFHVNVEQDNDCYLDQIIKTYEECKIRTEKLRGRDKLFAFKLNDTARVVATFSKYQGGDCLVVLNVLDNHEYHRCKYSNGTVNVANNVNDIKIVAISENFKKSWYKGKSRENLRTLPEIWSARIGKKIIILEKNQSDVLRDIKDGQPIIFKINGAAGSGKTTIAELLIQEKNASANKVLYITKSEELVDFVRKKCPEDSNIDYKTLEGLVRKKLPTNFDGVAYTRRLYDLNDFIEWGKEKKKEVARSFIKDNYKQKELMVNEMWRCIYEDIRKLHGKSFNNTNEEPKLSVRESYNYAQSPEILRSYKRYLNRQEAFDLSLLDSISDRVGNDEKYDCIIVDETQDFGKSELHNIKSFLKENCSIYLFMDPNQSSAYDFNNVSHYIDSLCKESNGKYRVQEYVFKHGYRTSNTVRKVANQILEWKRAIIGGSFNKDEQKSIKSVGNEDGAVLWLERDGDETVEKRVTELKDIACKSMNVAVIVPDNEDVKRRAEEMFSKEVPEQLECEQRAEKRSLKAMIFTPEQAKGLEFEQVIVFDFFGSNCYVSNDFRLSKNEEVFNSMLNSDEDSNEGRPKCTETAKKAVVKYALFMSSMFIAVTRSMSDVYFIETNKAEGAVGIIKKEIEKCAQTEKDRKIALKNNGSVSDMIAHIDKLKNKIEQGKLLEFCKQVYDKIDKSKENSVDFQEYLKKIIDILQGKKSSEIESFLKEVESSIQQSNSHQSSLLSSSSSSSILNSEVSQSTNDTQIIGKRRNRKKNTTDVQVGNLDKNTVKGLHGTTIENVQTLIDEIKNTQIDEIKDTQALIRIMIDATQGIAPEALEQKLGNINVLCNIIKTLSLKNDKQIQWFKRNIIPNITSTALEEYDEQGNSAVYHLIKRVLLHDMTPISADLGRNISPGTKIIDDFKELIVKITPKALNRIGPDGWSARHHLNCHETLRKKVFLLNKSLLNQENNYTNISAKVDTVAKGYNVLHIAAHSNDVYVVKLAIENGAKIDERNDEGCTALHLSAHEGHKGIVELLLEKGAKIGEKNNKGWNALHLAADKGHKDIVELLLEKGAKIDEKNNKGCTALHLAAHKGHKDIVELLLKKGAKIDEKNNQGPTALHLAADKGHKDIVQLLLEKRADINEKDNQGHTALHISAYEGHKDIVELLLEKEAKIDEKSNRGCTALHLAADKGHKDIVELLLEKGADINKKNNNMDTALHRAAAKGYVETIEFLLNRGALHDLMNKDNMTACDLAEGVGHIEVVNLFKKHLEKKGDVRSASTNMKGTSITQQHVSINK